MKSKFSKHVEAVARLARYACDQSLGELRALAQGMYTAGQFNGDVEADARILVEALRTPAWRFADSMFSVTFSVNEMPVWRVVCAASQVVPLAADWVLRSVFKTTSEPLDAAWTYPVHCQPLDCLIEVRETDGPSGVWRLSRDEELLDEPEPVLVDMGLAAWRSTLRVGRNHWDTLNRLDPGVEFELLPAEEGQQLPPEQFHRYRSETVGRADLMSGKAVLGARVAVEFGNERGVEDDSAHQESPADAAWFVAEALREAFGHPMVDVPIVDPLPLHACIVEAAWFIRHPAARPSSSSGPGGRVPFSSFTDQGPLGVSDV